MLANPAYAGIIARKDLQVPDAHPALIDAAMFRRAAEIAAARSGPHTQRAASPSAYHLSSLICCPGCGCKYIGQSATGRSQTYRYYICFTRSRYGPGACNATRIPAEEADTAALTALAAFYAQETAVLLASFDRGLARQDTGQDERQAQAHAVAGQIQAKQAAVLRYQAAFENGTMDDITAGPRLRELQQELIALKARQAELDDASAELPQPPPPGILGHLRDYLPSLVAGQGNAIQRKAAIEALIHEIRITEKGLIPVYQIPAPDTTIPGRDPVRAMLDSEPPYGIEP